MERVNRESEGLAEERMFVRADWVAAQTQTPVGTIRHLCAKGAIPFYRRGRAVYFKPEEILAWIECGRVA